MNDAVTDKSNLDIVSCRKTNSFADLEKKNRNFYAPACRVLADGEDIFTMNAQISSLSVDHSVLKAGACNLTVIPVPGAPAKRPLERIFLPGTVVEVYMGYAQALEAVFTGAVTQLSFSFSSSGSPEINVSCTDFSQLMMGAKKTHMWDENQFTKFSDVAGEILSGYLDRSRLTNRVIESVDIVQKPPFSQREQSDYSFIKNVADNNHIDFFVSGPNVYFKKRRADDKPVVTLTWGENLAGFHCNVRSAALVSSVAVTGWDAKEKKSFTAEAEIGDVKDRVGGDKIFDFAQKVYADGARTTVPTELGELGSAQKYAEEMLIEQNKDLFGASGDCVGIPQIMAGRVIAIGGVGDLFSGHYFITDVKHTLNTSGYRTNFTLAEVHG